MLVLRTSIGRFEPSAQMGRVRPVNFLAMSDKSKYTLGQQNLIHDKRLRREGGNDVRSSAPRELSLQSGAI